MATSCSHWWHCPVYFALSVTLAAIAVSEYIHSIPAAINPHPAFNPHPISSPNQTNNITHTTFIASRALQKHGFNAIATLLQLYPQLFLSSSQSTIFAIQDPSIFNKFPAQSKPMKLLLKYHTSPFKLPMAKLSKNPQGTCFPTLLPQKHIAITKTDPKSGSIEINNVLISHPDLFLDKHLSIHGVLGPFSSLNLRDIDEDWEIKQPRICDAKRGEIESKNPINWTHIIRFLSSNGFVTFTIRLQSALDAILRDYPDLNSVTIFAPLDFLFVTPSWPLLDRTVRFHVLPKRFTYNELSSLPEKTSIKTLVPDKNLVITTSNARAYSKRVVVAINGVEVAAPDSFSSKNFAIHGISRAFSLEGVPSTIM
ncbi:hypothetical protein U1Q18_001411 [Sarracenia purpurea var. burkii]